MDASTDCAFCRIARGEDPQARVLFRDPYSLAYSPLHPAAIGHTLVSPTLHCSDIWAMDRVTAHHVVDTVLSVSTVLRDVLRPDGLNVIQSNGRAASQTVDHLHVHLVPRWDADSFGPIWPPRIQSPRDEHDHAWQQIRRAIGA